MRFAWGVEKRERPAGAPAKGRFRCSKCKTPLELERVIGAEAERKGDVVTGYVVFHHSCRCTPVGVRASRSWGTHGAFCALFGAQPWLPYRAPFRFQPVAEDDPAVLRWHWELAQVADVNELLLYLDDARARRDSP